MKWKEIFVKYSIFIVIWTWAQFTCLLKSGQFGGVYMLQNGCWFGLEIATEFEMQLWPNDCTRKNCYCEVS